MQKSITSRSAWDKEFELIDRILYQVFRTILSISSNEMKITDNNK